MSAKMRGGFRRTIIDFSIKKRAEFLEFICCKLRWPEPIYMRVGYVLKSRFSAEKI